MFGFRRGELYAQSPGLQCHFEWRDGDGADHCGCAGRQLKHNSHRSWDREDRVGAWMAQGTDLAVIWRSLLQRGRYCIFGQRAPRVEGAVGPKALACARFACAGLYQAPPAWNFHVRWSTLWRWSKRPTSWFANPFSKRCRTDECGGLWERYKELDYERRSCGRSAGRKCWSGLLGPAVF